MDIFAAIFIGISLLTTIYLITTLLLEINKEKKVNNIIQNLDNELEYKIDNMTARELYIHKASQNRLIWDSRTQAYIKKWSKNDTTFH